MSYGEIRAIDRSVRLVHLGAAAEGRPLLLGRPGVAGENLGYENGRAFTVGAVRTTPNLITIAMASNDGVFGPDACQQALGVRDNVVVATRTCEAPHVTAGPDQGFPRDPRWAVPDVERVAKAMLENIAP